jgi:23S rRNA pseudouridine2605 synthase
LISAGRVRVNGKLCREPEHWVDLARDRITVDAAVLQAARKIYLMLNKPRGLVTTASDEHGRATVYDCLKGRDLPQLFPVGRLDKASEGLLLLTNDTEWANGITAPERHVDKTYHVQVNCRADDALTARLEKGESVDGDFLAANRAFVLRRGSRNCWLELVLSEGKNRHIRRLMAAFNLEVLRLVRVAIGSLELGPLAKGAFRHLNEDEVEALRCGEMNF